MAIISWNGEQIAQRAHTAAYRGVVRTTLAVHARGNQLILEPPKTGRIYTRRGVKHQASAPGEAPASDTGNLMQKSQTEFNQVRLSGVVRWGAFYAIFLELGTMKMAPRPFARRALGEVAPVQLISNVRAELAAEFRP